jgi:NO-binding membrane sensor protein with MHYT domain
MISHSPSLVILSTTIAILGAFTASVMMSNIAALGIGEGRSRVAMASFALGGSIWATHFVGLLALSVPVNLAYKPAFLAGSAAVALFGTSLALFKPGPKGESDQEGRYALAVATLGITIAATNYLGLAAVAGYGLRVSWFLALICVAVSIQAAGITVWFLYRKRGVLLTLVGSAFLGLCISAAHYLSIASTEGLDQTLLGVPQYEGAIPDRYLAWSATIVMYLICSICLCVFVIQQFREELE